MAVGGGPVASNATFTDDVPLPRSTPWAWWEAILPGVCFAAIAVAAVGRNVWAIGLAVLAGVLLAIRVAHRLGIPWQLQLLVPLLCALVATVPFTLHPAVVPLLSCCVLLTGLSLVLRMVREDWLGPLYVYDLIRLARRKRNVVVRGVFVAALGIGLAVAFEGFFGLRGFSWRVSGAEASPQLLAEFTARFVDTCWVLQNLAVMILTPAYVAGAITEENERRTLPLLFTTHLLNREIVLGKLFARLTHLAMVLLAGLPLLAITQVWGGVSLGTLALMYFVSFVTLLGIGGISIFCSVGFETVLGAVFCSYLLVACMNFGCICLGVVPLAGPTFVATTRGSTWLLAYAAAQLAVFIVGCRWAIRHVRQRGLALLNQPQRSVKPRKVPGKETIESQAKEPAGKQRSSVIARLLPRHRRPVGDDALLWKEAYHGEIDSPALYVQGYLGAIFGLYLLLTVIAISAAFATSLDQPSLHVITYKVNGLFRVFTVAAATVLCLGVGFRAAGIFCRERARQTLDNLLLMPASRGEVLQAKWWGALLRWRYLGVGLLAFLVLGMLLGVIHPLGGATVIVSVAAYAALSTSVGVWVSLLSRNATWAYLAMALAVLVTFLGSWIGTAFGAPWRSVPGLPAPLLIQLFETVLNPWVAWWTSCFGWQEAATASHDHGLQLLVLLGQMAVFALAGCFWLLAWRRLEREGRGPASSRAVPKPVQPARPAWS